MKGGWVTKEEKSRIDPLVKDLPWYYEIITEHLLGNGRFTWAASPRWHTACEVGAGCWSWTVWVQIRALPLNSWVPRGQFLHLPDLRFPHVSNGYHNSAHLVGCCEDKMNELIQSLEIVPGPSEYDKSCFANGETEARRT